MNHEKVIQEEVGAEMVRGRRYTRPDKAREGGYARFELAEDQLIGWL